VDADQTVVSITIGRCQTAFGNGYNGAIHTKRIDILSPKEKRRTK